MSRNKLIAKYSALNTEDLPQRIYDKIKKHIESQGIENLPYLELSGRWTGKLDISSGGWHNDFDLICPVLAMCRVNRYGEVYPDMAKIKTCVEEWVKYLITPDEYDEYNGADDNDFSDSHYDDDDINDFRSAAYNAELDSFLCSDGTDFIAHERALSEIDEICYGRNENIEGESIFEDGFNITRIDNVEDFGKLMGAMGNGTVENDCIDMCAPHHDMEKTDDEFDDREEEFDDQEDEDPDWMEFIDNLRNGRYGELPEDYDGLAEPEEKEEDTQ